MDIAERLAEGELEYSTAFDSELDKFFVVEISDPSHLYPLLAIRLPDLIHIMKNAEGTGMKEGLGNGVRPGCVGEGGEVRYSFNLLKAELLSMARLLANNKQLLALIQKQVVEDSGGEEVFTTIPGEVGHRMLIMGLLCSARCRHRPQMIAAITEYLRWTPRADNMVMFDHAKEVLAGLEDPILRVWEAGMVAVMDIHLGCYQVFQQEGGFTMYRVKADIEEVVARLRDLAEDTELQGNLYDAGMEALEKQGAAEKLERRLQLQQLSAPQSARRKKQQQAAVVAAGAQGGEVQQAPEEQQQQDDRGGEEQQEEDGEEADAVDELLEEAAAAAECVDLLSDDEEEEVIVITPSLVVPAAGAGTSGSLGADNGGNSSAESSSSMQQALRTAVEQVQELYRKTAQYLEEKTKVYCLEWPARVGAYFNPGGSGLEDLSLDAHKFGCCLGEGRCKHCDAGVALAAGGRSPLLLAQELGVLSAGGDCGGSAGSFRSSYKR